MENRQMQASSTLKLHPRPRPRNDAAQPIVTRSGKVLSLLIALEALRQQPHALGAQKV
jgi:hypothetical protein